MITGRNLLGVLKQFVQTPLRYIVFVIRFINGEKPRFLVLSFGISKNQLILDAKAFRIIKVLTPSIQDFRVLLQIFYLEHYRIDQEWMTNVETLKFKSNGTRLILDCGGNVGLAALYFCLTIPNSEVILIEPSARNMLIARENTKNLNCRYLTGAIASTKSDLVMIDPGLGPDAFRVTHSPKGNIETFTVKQVLASSTSMPFLIKIDIEGFESNLFEKNTKWIDSFPFLVIELHDWMLLNQYSSQNFLSQISKRKRNFIFRNENIFSF